MSRVIEFFTVLVCVCFKVCYGEWEKNRVCVFMCVFLNIYIYVITLVIYAIHIIAFLSLTSHFFWLTVYVFGAFSFILMRSLLSIYIRKGKFLPLYCLLHWNDKTYSELSDLSHHHLFIHRFDRRVTFLPACYRTRPVQGWVSYPRWLTRTLSSHLIAGESGEGWRCRELC